jgi:hypothetical protein
MKHLKRIAVTALSLLIITGICACGSPAGRNSGDDTSYDTQVIISDKTENEKTEDSVVETPSENSETEAESSIDISQNGHSEVTYEIENEDSSSFNESKEVENPSDKTSESNNGENGSQQVENTVNSSDTTDESADFADSDQVNDTEENVISENTEEISIEESGAVVEEKADNASETTENSVTISEKEVGDGDFKIVTSDGTVSKNGNTYTITSQGTYVLSGDLTDGQIVINAGDGDEVEIDLENAHISCSYDSPIYAVSADKVKIKAIEGTTNSVSDLRSYSAGENDTEGSAAIYALCDLNLIGTGTLNVTAKNYNNGIHTKDDLKIKDVVLTVSATNNALKGNDSVTIESGRITAVSTGGDAIKTDNSDISSKGNQKGSVTISGGTVTLTAADDGIDAAYDVVISGGDIEIIKAGGKGICANNAVNIESGELTVKYSADDAVHANNDNALENGETPEGNVTIFGGTINIVNTADDGIHADGTLLIKGGDINIEMSHEGLEGHYITIEDGNVYVYADDDALNATSLSNWSSDGMITISGGNVVAEVSGRDVDGIDSNGSYVQTGGFVVTSNPNSDGNGNMSAMDIDGSISITGGITVALGSDPQSSGMAGFGGGMGGFGGHGGGMNGQRGGMGGFGGGMGGFGGQGGGMGISTLPTGYVAYSSRLSAGQHTFVYNGVTYDFTLKNTVSGGWIWAEGITDSNYSLN